MAQGPSDVPISQISGFFLSYYESVKNPHVYHVFLGAVEETKAS